MKIVYDTLVCNTSANTDIIDITHEVEETVRSSGINNGTVLLFVSGSTAALTTIEYESGVVSDLEKAIERIAPHTIPYEHDRRWGDGADRSALGRARPRRSRPIRRHPRARRPAVGRLPTWPDNHRPESRFPAGQPSRWPSPPMPTA